MQRNLFSSVALFASDDAAQSGATVQPETVETVAAPVAAKPARKPRKPAAKQAAKPEAPAAKQAAKPSEAAQSSRQAERAAAAFAVSAYYNGTSLPFKSASDRFADLRTDKAAKKPSRRQAALLAVMLAADTADNIAASGQFVRGGFRIPARLIDPSAKPGEMRAVQPETGCLSDMLGRVIFYVSGPVSGSGQRDQILRVDLKRARVEISEQLGGDLAKAAIKRIDAIAKRAA